MGRGGASLQRDSVKQAVAIRAGADDLDLVNVLIGGGNEGYVFGCGRHGDVGSHDPSGAQCAAS